MREVSRHFAGFFVAFYLAIVAFVQPAFAEQTPPLKKVFVPITEIRMGTKRDVAPGPNVRLYMNTRNLPVVTVRAYKLDTARWLRDREVGQETGKTTRPTPLPPGKPVRTFTVTVGDPNKKPTQEQPDVYFSKQFNLPVLPPGAYLFVASGGGKEDWTVANITNLAVVLKRASRTVLVWVTDHRSGATVPKAKVTLWDRKGTKIAAQGETNADGVCQFAAVPNPEQTLLVERPGREPDMAGLPIGNQNPDGRLVSHLQTDRPIYRPGATVQYKAILRRTQGRVYRPEANTTIVAEVRDSRDNILQRKSLKTNAVGTLADSFEISSQGVLGAYTILLTMPDRQTVYGTFSVAEYRKPDFKATVTPKQKRYLSGEKGGFTIQADYYFGAPLPQASVRYTIRRSPSPFYGGTFSDDEADSIWFASGDGNLYPRDTYAAEPVVADGEVMTDKQGRAEIPFVTKGDLPDSNYTISCTVTDGQRRQVTAGASVPVYAALLRVGIRSRIYASPLNTNVPVELRLADLDGKPASGRVTLITRQQVWEEKEKRSVWRILSQSTVNVPATGKATAQVPAAKEGMVEIIAKVTDRTGRTAQASTSLWVTDPEGSTWREAEGPTLTVRLDRKTYNVGDGAQVFLTTSTPKRPTLLTIEGGDIFAYAVVRTGKPNFVWKVRTTVEMSPNAHVAAAQWARPAYMVSGSAVLPVPDRSRHLDIKVTPDKTAYRPGDTALYTISATDRLTGKPVSGAEVALAVVDESIFALRPDATPDPFGNFWGLRENLTETRASAPEEVSGGAYQRNTPDGIAPVREKFLDTAFWDAHVMTGPDGRVVTKVELPGNLTAWRATAIGVTESTQVGRTVSQITVSRPVMLRLATPRQFVQGDMLTLIGTVNNRTDRERACEVTLDAEGVTMADGESAKKTVTVPAKGEAKVEWRVLAATIPAPSGLARLEGTVVITDRAASETLADHSDRLRVSVPVRPRGVAVRLREGAALSGDSVDLTLDLPADRKEPASTIAVTVRGGAASAARADAAALYREYAYGTGAMADRLTLIATPIAPPADPRQIRDTIALLSRYQSGQGGWGWWEGATTDPRITARVLRALAALKASPSILPAGMPYPDNLLRRGLMGGENLYNQTGFWEERAPLAVALAALDAKYRPQLEEVEKRHQGTLSPYASLLLAEGLHRAGKTAEAERLTQKVLEIAVIGPDAAYIPAGERPGWRASTHLTTAQALETLVARKQRPDLQAKLARWLIQPSDGDGDLYTTFEDRAAGTIALLHYARTNGLATRALNPQEADLTLTVNGTAVPWAKRGAGTEGFAPLTALVSSNLLKDGANTVTVRRNGGDNEVPRSDVFVTAEATVYRPQETETAAEMRVLRRLEMQTLYGTWTEIKPETVVPPGAPVRVTVVVWPNETADALRVTEPLPSGFEYADGEVYSYSREEVRDGAITHYLLVSGASPVTFRYYLRAESEGTLIALPASGELIRRPTIRGGSAAQVLTVNESKEEKEK
jgi:uncharacterized protein YfaS (alpha-2-macroglobulin family)